MLIQDDFVASCMCAAEWGDLTGLVDTGEGKRAHIRQATFLMAEAVTEKHTCGNTVYSATAAACPQTQQVCD